MIRKEILKHHLHDFLQTLSIYDYIAYGWLFAVLFFLLLIALMSARSRPRRAILLILTTMILMIIGPIGVTYFLNKTVRQTLVVDQNSTRLHFVPDLIVTGSVWNVGYVDDRRCLVTAKIFKAYHHPIKDMINELKPLRTQTIHVEGPLLQGAKKEFRMVFKKFDYPGDYRVRISAECR